jgi:hypothetical protein
MGRMRFDGVGLSISQSSQCFGGVRVRRRRVVTEPTLYRSPLRLIIELRGVSYSSEVKMHKSSESVTCVKCGSIGSAEEVPRPAVGAFGIVDRHWIKQCWVCGFEWDEFEGRAAS